MKVGTLVRLGDAIAAHWKAGCTMRDYRTAPTKYGTRYICTKCHKTILTEKDI